MKKLFLAVVAIAISCSAYVQSPNFSGSWTGSITVKDKGTAFKVLLEIDSNKVIHFADDKLKEKWSRSGRSTSAIENSNFLFTWMSDKDFSSESETFKLSPVENDKLLVTWTRKCTVYALRKKTTDNVWAEQGSGVLMRSTPASNITAIKN